MASSSWGRVAPSPTNSEDLDALLSAKGPMSRLCTPPMVLRSSMIKGFAYDKTMPSFAEIVPRLQHRFVATLFAEEACRGASSTFYETILIEDMLRRAAPLPGLLAISYNILCDYNLRAPLDPNNLPGDLLSVAALAIASIWTDDHPPRFAYWADDVCDGDWTARRIDQTVMVMLKTIDWRLHDSTSAAAVTIALEGLTRGQTMQDSRSSLGSKACSLRISTECAVNANGTSWAHGQVTPDVTPPHSASYLDGTTPFLPLL